MKKWLATLGVITCVFGLTGCGAKETKVTGAPVDSSVESQLISFGESYVTGVAQAADAGQAEAYADNDAITAAIESYDSVKEDIGTIESFRSDDEYVVMPDDSTYEIVIGYEGTGHDGYVTLNVDSATGTPHLAVQVPAERTEEETGCEGRCDAGAGSCRSCCRGAGRTCR